MTDSWTHTYQTDDGTPLQRCPSCNADLTMDGAILMILVLGNSLGVEARTKLDGHGHLVDTADGAVSKGFHSSTECFFCGEYLDDMEFEE